MRGKRDKGEQMNRKFLRVLRTVHGELSGVHGGGEATQVGGRGRLKRAGGKFRVKFAVKLLTEV